MLIADKGLGANIVNQCCGSLNIFSNPYQDPKIRNPEFRIRIQEENYLRFRSEPDPTWTFLADEKNRVCFNNKNLKYWTFYKKFQIFYKQ